jgi:hypothetical protein
MADKKEFEIKVIGNVEPVKQFVTAIESADKSTENWGKKLKDVIKIQREQSEQEKKISERRMSGYKIVDEIFKALNSQEHRHMDNTAEMLVQSKKVAATVSQISDLNQKSYKLLAKNNQEEMTAVQSEIDALAKNAKSVDAVTKAYEKKKHAIEEQAAIARSETEALYNTQIEQAKLAGKDTVSLEAAKAGQIKRISEQLNKDLKKNSAEYSASCKTVFDKLVSGLSDNADVYVDKTSKKTKELMKTTATEAAEMLGVSEKTTLGIVKPAIEASEKAKEAAAGAKSAEETAKAATAEVKKTGEEAAKTAEASKKIVDIEATKGNIKAIKDVLDNYRFELKKTSENTLKQYDEEIKAAGDNAGKRKEIEARKAQAVKEFTEEILKLNRKKNELEKKEQDLGLLQWQQYAEKFSGVTKSVNSLVQQMGTSIKGIFSTISAGIDDEIKAIDDKTKEVDIKIAESNAEKNDLEADKLEAELKKKEYEENLTEESQKLTQEQRKEKADDYAKEISDLEHKIKEEDAIIKQETANKNKLDAEKKKKEQEKRKLEKIQRKIDLGMQITSGIANVAEGVTKALAKGPIIGQILAAIQAAQGAIQVGIMTAQLAKLEKGGLLRGKRHSQGGMRIEGTNMEVEGGEFVINRVSTDKNLGLVKYINEQRRELKPNDLNAFFSRSSQGLEPSFKRMFTDGGQLPVIEPTNNIDNESLIQAIKSIKIESKVAVTDIHKVEDNMTSVSGWSGV